MSTSIVDERKEGGVPAPGGFCRYFRGTELLGLVLRLAPGRCCCTPYLPPRAARVVLPTQLSCPFGRHGHGAHPVTQFSHGGCKNAIEICAVLAFALVLSDYDSVSTT